MLPPFSCTDQTACAPRCARLHLLLSGTNNQAKNPPFVACQRVPQTGSFLQLSAHPGEYYLTLLEASTEQPASVLTSEKVLEYGFGGLIFRTYTLNHRVSRTVRLFCTSFLRIHSIHLALASSGRPLRAILGKNDAYIIFKQSSLSVRSGAI
jgi:hypothetical protein